MGPKPGGGEQTSPKAAQAFPEQGASQLVSLARDVFLATEMAKELNLLRQMKPNGKSILHATMLWYQAAGRIQSSLENLDNAWYSLDVKWNGDGYEAYEKFMRFNVIKVVGNNRDVIFAMANILIELYNLAIDSYNTSVEHMSTVLDKALTINAEKERDALVNILTQFIRNNTTRRQTLEHALQKNQGKVAELIGQIALFRRPGAFPEDALDKNEWIYDPR